MSFRSLTLIWGCGVRGSLPLRSHLRRLRSERCPALQEAGKGRGLRKGAWPEEGACPPARGSSPWGRGLPVLLPPPPRASVSPFGVAPPGQLRGGGSGGAARRCRRCRARSADSRASGSGSQQSSSSSCRAPEGCRERPPTPTSVSDGALGTPPPKFPIWVGSSWDWAPTVHAWYSSRAPPSVGPPIPPYRVTLGTPMGPPNLSAHPQTPTDAPNIGPPQTPPDPHRYPPYKATPTGPPSPPQHPKIPQSPPNTGSPLWPPLPHGHPRAPPATPTCRVPPCPPPPIGVPPAPCGATLGGSVGAAAPPPPTAGAAPLWGCPPTQPHRPGGTPAPERLGGRGGGGRGGSAGRVGLLGAAGGALGAGAHRG